MSNDQQKSARILYLRVAEYQTAHPPSNTGTLCRHRQLKLLISQAVVWGIKLSSYPLWASSA